MRRTASCMSSVGWRRERYGGGCGRTSFRRLRDFCDEKIRLRGLLVVLGVDLVTIRAQRLYPDLNDCAL